MLYFFILIKLVFYNRPDINVAEDEAAAKEMVAQTGQMGVPVIMVDDQIIVGFNQEELKKALNLE